MKVLVATHSYSGNGAAVMLLAVLEYWVRELGWIVDVLLDIDAPVPDDLVRVGANVFSTAVPEDYDFALVNTVITPHFIETLAPRVPTVLWVHEGETVLWSSTSTSRDWRHLFDLPARIVFQGPWQTDSVFRSFLIGQPSGKAVCVRNGLPPLPENIVAKPRSKGRSRVAFVGGVYGRKRPQDLVDAILALGRDDVECVFVGTTDHLESIGRDHVARMRARPDIFKLVGELDRRSGLEYVAGADVFCLPSADESQPIAPLEAAALGIPCVLSDLPPYGGTWAHGVNCLLGPVGDASMLRWNLRALLEDETVRGQIIAGSRNLAKRFSIGTFLHRFTAEMPI
jgi:glycosyltransferase involved in cell wall biosynthesis